MAEPEHQKSHESEAAAPAVAAEGAVETKDRGLFDFLGKKEEKKPQEEVIASKFEEKVQVSEPEHKVEKQEEKKPSLLEKLHRSGSSSSSSSDEEEGEGKEKKKKEKKKKGQKHEDTAVPVEKIDEGDAAAAQNPEEKKGFLEKIKEKLPGHTKKSDDIPSPPASAPAPPVESTEAASHEGEAKEKKGILEKIKEKLPGYHSKGEEVRRKKRRKRVGPIK